MAINPLSLLKLKDKFQTFKKEHPDMADFGRALGKHALVKGTVLEIKATTPEGKVLKNEITMTQNDVEMAGIFLKK